jgi:predicted metal-dependent phosphoesterase TrpH
MTASSILIETATASTRGGCDVTTAAADLHVHSRCSNRPTEWLLQRLGAAECYTDPLVVYQRCRERGMTLVTITDHDTIDGALEIAHLANRPRGSERSPRRR